jgi:hypothetical protein
MGEIPPASSYKRRLPELVRNYQTALGLLLQAAPHGRQPNGMIDRLTAEKSRLGLGNAGLKLGRCLTLVEGAIPEEVIRPFGMNPAQGRRCSLKRLPGKRRIRRQQSG